MGTAVGAVAQQAEEVVDRNPWVEGVGRAGWVAKGVVYALMGMTAVTIGRGEPTGDNASPVGAIQQLVSKGGGRLLVAALAVGLVLYACWRLLSVALIRQHSGHAWLKRVGYLLSGLFYAALAWVAISAALHSRRPRDDGVESLSRRLMGSGTGRTALFVFGIVAIGVGLYFVVRKALGRSFLEEISLSKSTEFERRTITVAGVIGWLGRGIVTVLLGAFLVYAAVRDRSDKARGFDGAIREVARSASGRALIVAAGCGLIVYGVFCLVSVRVQKLDSGS